MLDLKMGIYKGKSKIRKAKDCLRLSSLEAKAEAKMWVTIY